MCGGPPGNQTDSGEAVTARPPRSIYRSIAAHLRRSILYVPIGQLSPSKLKRIRVVHVLDSYDRREAAKDYIW